MAPEIRHAPVRWIVVTVTMIVLALVAIGSAGYTVTVATKANKQEAEIIVLKANAAQTETLRESEQRTARLRIQAECRGSIAGSKIGTTIIEDLRSTYLELAANAANPDFVAALKQRASHLPRFPMPKCDPGKTKVKP